MALAAEIASRVDKFHRKLSEARAVPPAAESVDGSHLGPKPRSKPGDEKLTGKYLREGIKTKRASAHGASSQVRSLLAYLTSASSPP